MNEWQTLTERTCDGSTVTLSFWRNPISGEATVRVSYVSPGTDFILYPPNENALDAFHHPYAYLNRVLQRGTYADHSDDSKTRYAETR
jgi:hypothetical protein